jgi:putative membrane protein
MKYFKIIILAITTAFFFASCNNGGKGSKKYADSLNSNKNDSAILAVSKQESEFMVTAASDGLNQVKFGSVAEKKAHYSRVKVLAKMIVSDHAAADSQLKQIALKKNVTLPDSLSVQGKNELQRMSSMKGEGLDKAYIRKIYQDQQTMIYDFNKELGVVTDPAIKQWITKSIPLLKAHLDSAGSLSKMLDITPKNTPNSGAPAPPQN